MKNNYALFLALSGVLCSTSAFATSTVEASQPLPTNTTNTLAVPTAQAPKGLPAHIVGHVRNTETQEFLPPRACGSARY